MKSPLLLRRALRTTASALSIVALVISAFAPFAAPVAQAATMSVTSITVGVQSNALSSGTASSTNYLITFASSGGSGSSITFTPSVSGLPAGVVGAFASTSITLQKNSSATTTLTVTTQDATPQGSTNFKVGTSNNSVTGQGTLVVSSAAAFSGGISINTLNGQSPSSFSCPSTPLTNPVSLTGSGSGSAPPGDASQYRVQIDWGDGVVDDGLGTFTPSSGHVAFTFTFSDGPHTYATNGTYAIKARLYHQTTPGNDNQADSVATITTCVQAIPTYTMLYDGNGNDGGSAPLDGNSPYNSGSTVSVLDVGTLTLTGNNFVDWNTQADGSGTSYLPGGTFSIMGNTTLFAQWAAVIPVTHTITASAGAGGSITPSGSVIVNDGSSQSFTIAPLTGYAVSDVSVDGASQGAITSYSFNNVTGDHTIAATFAPILGGLEIKKVIVGGPSVPFDDFSFQVTGSTDGTGSAIPFDPSGITDLYSGIAQTWSVAEVASSTYATTYSNSENANANCNNLTLSASATTTCTITNTYNVIAPATFMVTYDGNGATSGAVPTDSNAYASGSTVMVQDNTGNLALAGSTFNGWNTKADGTGTAYAAGNTFSIGADITLFAQWQTSSSTGGPSTPAPTTVGSGGSALGGGGGGGNIVSTSTPTTTPSVSNDNGGVVLGTSTEATVCPMYLSGYIKYGAQNDPGQVTLLQQFLNNFENNNLTVSGVYDAPSLAAVHAFQSKYASDVLAPWGASQSTGYVYYTTRKEINTVYCNFTRQFPLTSEQTAEIARIKALGEAYQSAPDTTTTPATVPPQNQQDENATVGVQNDASNQTAAVGEASPSSASSGSWWSNFIHRFFGK